MARSTIAMVAIFVVLAAGVWAYDKTQPAQSADKTVYVLEVKDTEVQRLDVTTSAGTVAFERAEPFGWNFADSGQQADLSRVSSVANRLAKLRSSAKVVDNPTDLGLYGLNPPPVTATLTLKDGTTRRVLIGNKTVNDAAYYAMVEGSTTLHTINTLIVGDIEKLVTEPPVPTPTPDPAHSPTPTAERTTPTATRALATPEPTAEPTPTAGLPAPSTN